MWETLLVETQECRLRQNRHCYQGPSMLSDQAASDDNVSA